MGLDSMRRFVAVVMLTVLVGASLLTSSCATSRKKNAWQSRSFSPYGSDSPGNYPLKSDEQRVRAAFGYGP